MVGCSSDVVDQALSLRTGERLDLPLTMLSPALGESVLFAPGRGGGMVRLEAGGAWVVPDLLQAFAFGLPLPIRVGIVFVLLAPLGFVMGMPFPLALRILRPEASAMVPWAWALNGWMSVAASLGTVLVSRLAGYDVAFSVALAAYGGALLSSRYLDHIGIADVDGLPASQDNG